MFLDLLQNASMQSAVQDSTSGISIKVEVPGKDREVNVAGLIETLFCLLLLFLPVFFLPFTADAFSVNKAYLVMFVSVLALLLLLFRGFQKGSLHVLGLGAYIGAIVLVLGVGVSVIFSLNKNTSLFGSYGNYSASFISIFSLLLLSFVASNTKLSVSKLIKSLLAGVTLSTLVSFLAFYGVAIPGIGKAFKEFSLVGSSSALFGLQVASALLSFYYLSRLSSKRHPVRSYAFYAFVLVINTVYLLSALNFFAVLSLAIGLIYIGLSGRIKFAKSKTVLVPVVMAIVLLTFVNFFPVTRSILGVEKYNQPLRLPITESWLISASTVRDFPFTGSGVGTFVVDFTRYRPASLNATNFWGARFVYPFNDIFLFLATTGLIGIASYVLFWIFSIKRALNLHRAKETNFLLPFLVIVTFVVLMLLGYNFILYVLLFIFLGVIAQYQNHGVITVRGKNALLTLMFLGLILFGSLSFQAYRVYAGQYFYRQSLLVNDAIQRYNLQKRALLKDAREPVYRRGVVFTGLFIARRLSQLEDLSAADSQQIQQLVRESVLDARRLTEVINPLDVANWEVRGSVYDALIGVAQNAEAFAITAYSNAINLEPTNPRLWVGLGSVYYRQKAYQNAVQAFARAVQLKNDYANAHYNLAYALKDTGDLNNAVIQLEIVARLIPQDSSDYERVTKELEDIRKLAQEQRVQQAAKLPVEEQNPEKVERTKEQEPLTGPQETGKYQLEPKEEVEIPEEVLNPPTEEGEGKTPETSGEAPLAQPPAEE